MISLDLQLFQLSAKLFHIFNTKHPQNGVDKLGLTLHLENIVKISKAALSF